MDERSDEMDKVDEVLLPGFRFHPTDEELVGFYLKRKIQQKPLSIELIRQLDIYKYDPWDLPKLATTGEKEWYFYCPRDRKYRNSTRPNRVTQAGFWKATGTDRPIYSSEGTRCIGLKKSLVFYKGRAAKGVKTDWMMHEFRLPSLIDSSQPRQTHIDKNIPANDSWAICRIFKKTNSMAQRALSHSWVSALPETNNSDTFSVSQTVYCSQFGPENIFGSTEAGSSIQFGCNNGLQQQGTATIYPPLDVTNSRQSLLPISNLELPANFMFSPDEMSVPSNCTLDVASMLLNVSPTILGDVEKPDVASMLLNLSPTILGDVEKPSLSIEFGQQQQFNGFTVDLPLDMNEIFESGEEEMCIRKTIDDCNASNNQWGTPRTVNFPFNLSPSHSDEWKPNLPWDSPPCRSEMSTSYSTNKWYTY